jgi:hypothetical protein
MEAKFVLNSLNNCSVCVVFGPPKHILTISHHLIHTKEVSRSLTIKIRFLKLFGMIFVFS